MNFIYSQWLPLIILFIVTLITLIIIFEKNYFGFVKKYWFKSPTIARKISTLCLIIGVSIFLLVLLDPRGPEQRIPARVTKDQTIILLDTSTSMLAEDVRPNRLERGIWLAKHFARNAVGQELAVLIFADITKKLVPFTTDGDLIDARLDGIKDLKNLNAGSGITQAIAEAVRFFPPSDDISGNIVVFTDGEETHESLDFQIPENVQVIVVGVGTTSGAPIPLRNNTQLFYGNKKFRGETVISKLDPKFFDALEDNNKQVKSIVTRAHEVPTEKIISLISSRKIAEEQKEQIVRPVDLEKWIIPGSFFLFLSFILRQFRAFALIFLILTNPTYSNEKKVEFSEEALVGLERLKNNQLSSKQKIRLADILARDGADDLARTLYREELSSPQKVKENPESSFNWGTLEFQGNNYNLGSKLYQNIYDSSQTSDELKQKIKENLKRIFAQGSNGKGKGKDKDKQKKDQSDSSSDSQDSTGESDNSKDPSDQDKEQSDKNPFDPKNSDEENKSNEQEKKAEEEKNEKGEKKQPNLENQNEDQGAGKEKKNKELSPLLDQLKSDDRKLQMKLLDTATQDKKNRPKKDW